MGGFFDQALLFFSQPLTVVLLWTVLPFGIVMLFGMLLWGARELYLDSRQGKFASQQKWVTLAIDVPAATEQSPKAVENIFAIVKGTKATITAKEKWIDGRYLTSTSFEIVSIDGYIQFFIFTNAKYKDVFEAAVWSQYPDATITEVDDYTNMLPSDYPNDTHELFGGEISLDEPDYFPIKTYDEFEHMASKDQKLKDPLTLLLENMSKMQHGEQFWFQLTINPGGDDGWVKKGQDFITKLYGKDVPSSSSSPWEKIVGPLAGVGSEIGNQLSGLIGLGGGGSGDAKAEYQFPNVTHFERAQADGVAKKITKLGYMGKIRWAYIARHDVFNKGGRNALWKGYIAIYTSPGLNKFKYDPDTMPRDDYFYMVWEYRAKQRKLASALKSRSWGAGSTPSYYSIDELATLWHFPTFETKTPLIKKTEARRGEAPTYLPTPGYGDSADLPDEPLLEVDEQGRPIARAGVSSAPAAASGLDDILPSGPMMEPGEVSAEGSPSEVRGDAWQEGEDDMPFVPPNLPV